MSAVNLQPELSSESWDKQRTKIASDKAVAAKLDGGKLAEALKKLNKANSDFKYDDLAYSGATTAKQLDEAVAGHEAQVKGEVKDLRNFASQSGTAAKDFVTAAQKVKSMPGDSGKLVGAGIAAGEAVSKAAVAFERDLVKYVETTRVDLDARLKQARDKEKKAGPAPAAGGKPVVTKAGKLVRTRALECIRKIKKPQPGAKPFRFVVVAGKTSVTVYLGVMASTAQEKLLKGLIPTEKPYKTYKDPKGEVIWEKNAITLVSDRLPLGLAKKMQIWLKKLTALNARIRIRKTTGEVEESDEGEDIKDDQLKPDAADAADAEAKKQAGKDFMKRLSGMAADVKVALAGPMSDEIKELVVSITKAGNAKDFEEADAQLDEMEALLAEATEADKSAPKISIAEVNKAKTAWGGARIKAISEIKRLAAEIGSAFKDETAQKAKVGEAVTRLYGLIPKLGTTLETQLDAAVKETDPAKQKVLVTKAKLTLDGVAKLLDEDDLMINIDDNEVVPGMKIVEPMRDRLAEVEAALG